MFSSSLKGQSTRMLGLVTANLFTSAGSFLEKTVSREMNLWKDIPVATIVSIPACAVSYSNLWLPVLWICIRMDPHHFRNLDQDPDPH